MRLLIWLSAALLLTNVGVYFWPTSDDRLSGVYAAQGDVSPNFIRLNKEIEIAYQDKQSKAALPSASANFKTQAQTQTQSSTQTSLASGSGEATRVAQNYEGDCYRLGPFLHRENFELAKAVLFNASVDFNSSKRVAKESQVYRVYLGEFDNRADVIAARDNLKRLKVQDHFVRKLDGERFLISLGIYTALESANRAASQMEGVLDRVKIRDELVTLPDSFWLHFSLANNGEILRQLNQIDWGEQSAKLGRFSCDLAQK